MLAKSIRFPITLAVLLTLLGVTACGPKPTQPPSTNVNMTPTATPPAAPTCSLGDTQLRDLLLDEIEKQHVDVYKFINVKVDAYEVYLQGYTRNANEWTRVKGTIDMVLQSTQCTDKRIDTCLFYESEPADGHPMKLTANGCTPPYTQCGSICLPPPEVCAIDRKVTAGSPSPTPTGSPSPTPLSSPTQTSNQTSNR